MKERETAPEPVLTRAENAVDRAIRYATACGTLAGQRLRHLAEQVRTEAAAHVPQADTSTGTKPARKTSPARESASVGEDGAQAALTRAEDVVDRVGQQVGRATTAAGLSLLRLGARAREEAEDIWAEAESLRQRRGG